MLKMIFMGGLAISIFCFFMTQNESHRRNRNGYPNKLISTKYGPPSPPSSEFYDYPPPPSSSSAGIMNNDASTSTEPYFRIVLSKKSKSNKTSTNPKMESSISRSSTTAASKYFNGINNDASDDDYKDFARNFTLFPFLNETVVAELEKLLYDNEQFLLAQNSSKITTTTTSSKLNNVNPVIEDNNDDDATSTPRWSRLIPENETEINSTAPMQMQSRQPFTTLSALSQVVSTSATILSPSTKVTFQTTTVNSSTPKTETLTESTISANLLTGRDNEDGIQTVTESQNVVSNTKFPSTSKRPMETLTESTKSTQDLSYLPSQSTPPLSLSLPETMATTLINLVSNDTNSSELQKKNISQPSRLYLPPSKQNF